MTIKMIIQLHFHHFILTAQNNIASIAKCIYECFHHDSLIFVLHRESVNDYFANRA